MLTFLALAIVSTLETMNRKESVSKTRDTTLRSGRDCVILGSPLIDRLQEGILLVITNGVLAKARQNARKGRLARDQVRANEGILSLPSSRLLSDRPRQESSSQR